MKKQFIINALVVLVALSPIAYLLAVWDSIPESFTTKIEFKKRFEETQSRQDLMMATISLAVGGAGLYILMRNLRRVDPKVNEATPKGAFHKLGLTITFFLVILNYFFISSVKNEWIINTAVLVAFIGLFISMVGNYMNNLKPNYFAGIRLPWTLNDPENWRRTHSLAGKIWFAGGILLIIISFLLSEYLLIPFIVTVFVIIVIIPCIYSYRIYRRKQHNG
jgi:MFS family permease